MLSEDPDLFVGYRIVNSHEAILLIRDGFTGDAFEAEGYFDGKWWRGVFDTIYGIVMSQTQSSNRVELSHREWKLVEKWRCLLVPRISEMERKLIEIYAEERRKVEDR